MGRVGGQKRVVNIFKGLKKNTVNQEFYIDKIVLKSKKKIKTFSDKQKLRVLVTTRPALQEVLEGALQRKMEGH